jgi:hypothetical protein
MRFASVIAAATAASKRYLRKPPRQSRIKRLTHDWRYLTKMPVTCRRGYCRARFAHGAANQFKKKTR